MRNHKTILSFLPLIGCLLSSAKGADFNMDSEVQRTVTTAPPQSPIEETIFTDTIAFDQKSVNLTGWENGFSFSFNFAPADAPGFEYIHGDEGDRSLAFTLSTPDFSVANEALEDESITIEFQGATGSPPGIGEGLQRSVLRFEDDQIEFSFGLVPLEDFSFSSFTISGFLENDTLMDGDFELGGSLVARANFFGTNDADDPGPLLAPIPEPRTFALIVALGAFGVVLLRRTG